jgi:hypothetical protein
LTASIVIRTSQPKPAASGKQASRALGDPEPATLPLGECGDCEIALGGSESREVAVEIGVDEEEPAGRRRAFRERQGLTLAARGEAQHPGPGTPGRGGSPVARAVVGDDHLDAGKGRTQRLHRSRDRRFLVARGDEDC